MSQSFPDQQLSSTLTADIVRLVIRYGRYGHRCLREMLGDEGWRVSAKRIYRICWREWRPSQASQKSHQLESSAGPTWASRDPAEEPENPDFSVSGANGNAVHLLGGGGQ